MGHAPDWNGYTVFIILLPKSTVKSLCILAHRFIFWSACPLFLPVFYVLEEKAESGYFSAISRNQASLADGWWCMRRLTGYVRKFMAFQSKGMCLRPVDLTKHLPGLQQRVSLAQQLHSWSVHSQQVWSSWDMSDIWHVCCINRNRSLGFLEEKSRSLSSTLETCSAKGTAVVALTWGCWPEDGLPS